MSEGLAILIVDDEPSVREFIRARLAPHYPGARLLFASDGEEGLALAKKEKPDLVLLDVWMPKLDGWALCEKIKQDPKLSHTPVLMMSGVQREPADRARGMRGGADAYLYKPFEADELLAQIAVLLRIKKNEEALRRHQEILQQELDQRTTDLRASEQRFRTLFEQSPDAMFVESKDGTVLDANKAAGTLHGVQPFALIGKHVTDLVPPAHKEIVQRDYPKWFSGEITFYEGYSYTGDGRIVPVEVKANRIEYEGQSAILLTVRDTTDRPYEEDRRAAMTRGLRAIVEIADDLIACPDLDTLFRRAIEMARRSLGLERASIFLSDGHLIHGTFGTDLNGQITDERSHTFPINEMWRDRFRLRAPNEARWTLSFEPIRDWSGEQMTAHAPGWVSVTPIQTASKAVGVFCNDSAITRAPFDPVKQELVAVYSALLANIIERKSAEAEIRLLAAALEQSAEYVVITDLNGTITYVNPAFEHVTGYTRAEAIGKNPRILKSGKMPATYYTAMWGTLMRGEVWSAVVTNRRKDGRLYNAKQVVSPIKSPNGDLTAYLSIAQDITREVAMEQALQQSQKMESIGRLAGGIAHDFNNLFTGILGFARLIKTTLEPNHACQEDLDEIIKSGERAAGLTRQLLAFGRKQVVRIEPLDLNAVISEIDQLLNHSLGRRYEIVKQLEPNIPLVVADSGMIEQVILNLTINARDAMPNGGKLTIGTTATTISEPRLLRTQRTLPAGEYAVLSVRDTGTGIGDDIAAQIFEPFFTTKEAGRGVGLGLSTVYSIIKRCHGYIDFDTTLGAGTEFRLYFPPAKEEALGDPAAADSAPAPSSDTPQKKLTTILLAEDEDAIRHLIVRTLAPLGHRILETSNGTEALQLFRQNKDAIGLLLTDILMPGISGTELAQLVHKENPLLPVLYMSGFAENIFPEGAPATGRDILILKPFSAESLIREVQRILPGA